MRLKISGRISENSIEVFGIAFAMAIVSVNSLVPTTAFQKILWVILAIWGVIAIFYTKKFKKNLSVIAILIMMVLPFVLAMLYTVILKTTVGDPYRIRVQCITTTMFIVVDALMLFSLFMIFKKNMINILYYAIIFAFFINIAIIALKRGLPFIIQYLFHRSDYQEWWYFTSFEQHDVGIAVVPLLLYYIDIWLHHPEFPRKKLYTRLAVLTVILMVCEKRSAFLAIVVGVILLFLFRRKKRHQLLTWLILINSLVLPYLYVLGIKEGIINNLFNHFGVNAMGRIDVWDHFKDYYSISPLYLGQGFQFVHCYMSQGMGSKLVNNFAYLHNSILQIYIECGCLIFFVWFFMISIGMYLLIRTMCNVRTGYFYLVLLGSMLAAFTVDNILTYPLYQICHYGVLICFLLNSDITVPNLKKWNILYKRLKL